MTDVERLRERTERIRRQQLQTAIRKLESSGELPPAERQVLTDLSVRLTEAIVDPWVSGLSAEPPHDLATRLFDDDW